MKETQRKRKKLIDICNTILSLSADDIANQVVNPELADKVKGQGLELYDLMVLKMAEEALHGNVKAFTAVRDSAGDKPVDTSEIKAEVVTDTDMELVRNVAERLSGKRED